MKLLRCILYPLALLYGFIVAIRNFLFDRGFLKTHTISMPSIGVGNLSSGGTGKSIVIDYLIVLLKKKYSISVLSRGYKRETSGVIVGTVNSSAAIIGDEPLQFLKKHPSINLIKPKKIEYEVTRKANIIRLLRGSRYYLKLHKSNYLRKRSKFKVILQL